MKFFIERNSLLHCLAKVQGIVEKRNTMPILANALMSIKDAELELIATDLEITLIDRIPVDVQEEGQITVSAKKLFEIVRDWPEGPMEITSKEDNKMEIKGLHDEFNLMGMSPEEFPKIPDTGSYKFGSVDGPLFKKMVERTIYASGSDDGRYSLHGIYMEKLEDDMIRFVGTDGHRLAMIDRVLGKKQSINIKKGIILPRKGMSELIKILEGVEGDIKMAIKENNVAFEVEKTVLMMRLIDGEFPDYQRVIVEGCDKKVILPREELLKNIRRVSTLIDEKARAIKFSFTEDHLVMEGKNPFMGTSHSEMNVEYKGEPINVGYNDRYLADILATLDEEKVILEFKNEESPTMVKVVGDDHYLCVIMPMRLT